MKLNNQRKSRLANHAALKDSRTSRFNLPVRHPALWRFVLDQILSAPMRLHRYRHFSVQVLEDVLGEMDCRNC